MAKKLIVKTDVGTFTRSTERTYTHIVVVKGYRAEVLEASRLARIAAATKERDKYVAAQLPGYIDRDGYSSHAQWVADGSYAKWAAGLTEDIATLVARGPITEDANEWSDFDPRYIGYKSEARWGVLGWNGRLDLALKLASGKQAISFRDVRVYAIDGTRVL